MQFKNYLKLKYSTLQACKFALLLLSFGLSQSAWSESYLADAKDYLQKGEYKSAVIQLKNVLQESPNNAEARFMLGEIYVIVGDGASAEKELLRAEKLGSERSKILIPLARAYLLQRQWDNVLSDINISKTLSVVQQATIISLKGQAYLAMQQLEEAREKFEEAIELFPASIDAILGFARLALVEKDYDVAARHIGHAVDLAPGAIEGWLLKGELARFRQNYPAAKTAFQQALKLDNNNLPAHVGMATTQVALGQFDEAMLDVKAIQKVFPNHPLANYLSGAIAFEKRDFISAEESLLLVLRAAPNHFPSFLLLGGIYYSQGKQLEQAANYLSRYVTAIPNHLPARKLLAATYLKTLEADKAIAVLKSVMDKASGDPQLLGMLGSAYMQKRDFERGIEFFEQAVAIDPDVAETRTQLAVSHLATGETGQAISELKIAVDMGQDLLQADVLLILTYINQKNFEEALQLADKLVKKMPDNPVPYNLQGVVHSSEGHLEAARKSFEQVLRLEPMFFSAEMSLARLDELEGNVKNARQRYKNILRKSEGYLSAMLSLARLDEKAGNNEGSLNWVELAKEKNPDALEPGLILARYYIKKGDKLKAIVIMRELFNIQPNNPLVLEMLGEAQLANKESMNALATFKRLAELHPEVPRAYYLLGVASKNTEDEKLAIKSFKQALILQSDFLPAQLALVDLAVHGERKDEALNIALQIQQQQPDKALGYIVEGDIYIKYMNYLDAEKAYINAYQKERSGKLALKIFDAKKKVGKMLEARKVLEQWLDENRDDIDVRVNLAMDYQGAGLHSEAIKQYQHILSLQPKHMVSLNNLAWLYGAKNDERGVKFAERAYSLAPENPAVVDTYGWLLLNNGDVSRGLQLIQEAAMRAPHMLEIRHHLAIALKKAGFKEESDKELERIIRSNPNFIQENDEKTLSRALK